jgi:hypothetical protein
MAGTHAHMRRRSRLGAAYAMGQRDGAANYRFATTVAPSLLTQTPSHRRHVDRWDFVVATVTRALEGLGVKFGPGGQLQRQMAWCQLACCLPRAPLRTVRTALHTVIVMHGMRCVCGAVCTPRGTRGRKVEMNVLLSIISARSDESG